MQNITIAQIAHLLMAEIDNLSSLSNAHAIQVSDVSVDSRSTKSGSLFFALPGARVDGQTYLAEAATKGAVAAVVSKNYTGYNHGLPLLKVEDCLQALQDLAKENLRVHNPCIVAVTGSVGKTTTKDCITTLLQQKYRVTSSPGNSNSQIGLPLAILNCVRGNEDILVLEMGMTHAGNIANLVKIAPPKYRNSHNSCPCACGQF